MNILRQGIISGCLFLSILFLFGIASSGAIEIVEFHTPEQHEQYKRLISELRCMVCQNQSLADSNADLAKDMRAVTVDMIRNDAEDAEIIKFMVERYGDFVLYRPPFNAKTLALWLVPFLLLFIVLLKIPSIIRNQQAAILNEADQQKASQLLNKK